MAIVAEHGVSIVLSSHLVADLERVCDYLVVLVASGSKSQARSRNCSPVTTGCAPHIATVFSHLLTGKLSRRATPIAKATLSFATTDLSTTGSGPSSNLTSKTSSSPT